MTQDQAIEKIKKLLELSSNKAASEGEVQNATAIAQKLMLKFNISDSELSFEDTKVSDIEFEQTTKTTVS